MPESQRLPHLSHPHKASSSTQRDATEPVSTPDLIDLPSGGHPQRVSYGDQLLLQITTDAGHATPRPTDADAFLSFPEADIPIDEFLTSRPNYAQL